MKTLIPRLARRKKRVSSRIRGSSEVPRVVVFRSNKYLYAQVVNDDKRHTLTGVSTAQIEKSQKLSKTDAARRMGKMFAEILKEKKISKIVFDRSRFLYLGRVKHFVEGLREGGIQV